MNAMKRNESLSYPMESGINLQLVMRQVYIWMSLGMLLTAIVAYATVNTALINLATNPIVLLVAIIAEFGLVMGIGFGFSRISSGTAGMLFFVYAALNGFTLSTVLLAFSTGYSHNRWLVIETRSIGRVFVRICADSHDVGRVYASLQ